MYGSRAGTSPGRPANVVSLSLNGGASVTVATATSGCARATGTDCVSGPANVGRPSSFGWVAWPLLPAAGGGWPFAGAWLPWAAALPAGAGNNACRRSTPSRWQ